MFPSHDDNDQDTRRCACVCERLFVVCVVSCMYVHVVYLIINPLHMCEDCGSLFVCLCVCVLLCRLSRHEKYCANGSYA